MKPIPSILSCRLSFSLSPSPAMPATLINASAVAPRTVATTTKARVMVAPRKVRQGEREAVGWATNGLKQERVLSIRARD
jgi:hypothetical protein